LSEEIHVAESSANQSLVGEKILNTPLAKGSNSVRAKVKKIFAKKILIQIKSTLFSPYEI
jgi:hypothetical protein